MWGVVSLYDWCINESSLSRYPDYMDSPTTDTCHYGVDSPDNRYSTVLVYITLNHKFDLLYPSMSDINFTSVST